MWRVLGVSVKGLSHERSGLPCQDASYYMTLEDPKMCVVAVSDGAGSARHSDEGAQKATQAVVKTLADAYQKLLEPLDEEKWREIAQQAAQAALKEIESHSRDREGTQLRDYACTLMTVVVTPRWVAGFQIGDGAILISKGQKDLELLVPAPSGEYLNETIFLTSANTLDSLSARYVGEHVDKVAIMTDGLSLLALKMPEQVPHYGFFRPFFDLIDSDAISEEAKKKQMEEFFTSDRVRQRTDDDITLVLISVPPDLEKPSAQVSFSVQAPETVASSDLVEPSAQAPSSVPAPEAVASSDSAVEGEEGGVPVEPSPAALPVGQPEVSSPDKEPHPQTSQAAPSTPKSEPLPVSFPQSTKRPKSSPERPLELWERLLAFFRSLFKW